MQTSRTDFLPGRSWTHPSPTRAPRDFRPVVWLVTILDRLVDWQERASQRRALATLDDRMLKDLGLTRADVAREAGKPFWRS
jgi:uncharacterized protein YjiS (DUF1127 family)